MKNCYTDGLSHSLGQCSPAVLWEQWQLVRDVLDEETVAEFS